MFLTGVAAPIILSASFFRDVSWTMCISHDFQIGTTTSPTLDLVAGPKRSYVRWLCFAALPAYARLQPDPVREQCI
jgi:hypothetical protein